MTLAELSKNYGVDATQIRTWKRAAIEKMATAFTRRGAASERVSAADVDKLHSKIGQLVVERDFLVDASHRLTVLGREAKNGEQEPQVECALSMQAADADQIQSVL